MPPLRHWWRSQLPGPRSREPLPTTPRAPRLASCGLRAEGMFWRSTVAESRWHRFGTSVRCQIVRLPAVLATLFLGVPLVAHLAMVVGLRETPVRSAKAAQFVLKQGSVLAPLGLAFVAALLYSWSNHSREETLYLAITLSSLLGARVVAAELLRTFTRMSYFYLDPAEWQHLNRRGDRWRYEMRQHYIEDPEYVDALILDLVEASSSYAVLLDLLLSDDFPETYRDILNKRLWGVTQPSVRALAHRAVPTEVFVSKGKFTSERTSEEIFEELKELHTSGDHPLLKDRWQYYWCLRNLNLIDRLLKRALEWYTNVAVVTLGAVIFGAIMRLANHNRGLSLDLALRSLAAGSLLWLLVVASGASLFIVRVFRGTGTFTISDPSRGTRFDPLWSEVIKIGITSFAISFVIYGIGSPFLLDPGALAHFQLDDKFVAYAGASFLFCALVFANHTSGVHDLMLGSRTNALDRVTIALKDANGDNQRLLERFKEVRELRVWPLRGATIAQLAAGILFPVVVQAILLYGGLKAGS
jgi:hypothetical protein